MTLLINQPPIAPLARAFQAAHKVGREQLTANELAAVGFELQDLQILVAAGKLKRGVQGYWLPRPCDPGFLTVVDTIVAHADRDDASVIQNTVFPTTLCVNHRTANAGRLTGRFG